MSPADLIARATEHGFRFDMAATGPVLLKAVPDATLPPGLLADLTAHRAALVAYLRCRRCGRVTASAEDRALLKHANPFCDQPACPMKDPEPDRPEEHTS
jgi:hypothetical protein